MNLVAFRRVIAASAVLILIGAGSASALPTSLNDFAIFAGGTAVDAGTELAIGGNNLIEGNIGSNQDINVTGDSQILGSIYAGRNARVGSNSAVGSNGVTPGPDLQSSTRFVSPAVYPLLLAEIVANGEGELVGGTRLYGNLYAKDAKQGSDADVVKAGGVGGNLSYSNSRTAASGADVQGTITGPAPTLTFSPILTLTPGASFTATGVNQTVNAALDFLKLAPGPSNTYGSLATSEQQQTIRLSSGDYYFSSLTAQGKFTLEVDLTSGAPININIVGAATFGQDTVLKVKGAGTGGIFKPISEAEHLASLIHWTLGGKFTLGGGDNTQWTTIFGGIVYSGANNVGIDIGQHVDWYGRLYAFDAIALADHSRYNFVPDPPPSVTAALPEPATVTLGVIAVGAIIWRRRNARA